jgi:hypothetical protein
LLRYLRGWSGWLAGILDAVFEAFEALAEAFTQLWKALGAEENEHDQTKNQQVGRLKKFTHTISSAEKTPPLDDESFAKFIVAQSGNAWLAMILYSIHFDKKMTALKERGRRRSGLRPCCDGFRVCFIGASSPVPVCRGVL